MYRRVLALCSLLAVAAAHADEVQPRDPMRPYHAVAGAAGERVAAARFHLTAVLISASRRVAVVNGQPYLLGETVDGATIARIEAQTVRLKQGNDELLIHLGPGDGRRSRKAA